MPRSRTKPRRQKKLPLAKKIRRPSDEYGESELTVSPVFHANPLPTSLTVLDTGRYVAVNDAWSRTFGFSQDEVCGKTSIELGIWVLTGAFASPAGGGTVVPQMYFQVGANMDQRERVYIGTMTARGLGLQAGTANTVSVSAPDPANRTIGIVDEALRRVSRQRADLGAYQNRFELAAKGVAVASENMQAAELLIRDADIAAQMVEYTKDSILVQSSTAMLAQANLKPRSVLQLLA